MKMPFDPFGMQGHQANARHLLLRFTVLDTRPEIR